MLSPFLSPRSLTAPVDPSPVPGGGGRRRAGLARTLSGSGQHTLAANQVDDALDGGIRCQALSHTAFANLELDLTAFQPLRADNHLVGQPDQIHGCELHSRPLVRVVVKDLDSGAIELLVGPIAGLVRRNITSLQVDEPNLERGNGYRPDDSGIVVTSL